MDLIDRKAFKAILETKSDLLRTGCPDNAYGIFLAKVIQMLDLMPGVETEPPDRARLVMEGHGGYRCSKPVQLAPVVHAQWVTDDDIYGYKCNNCMSDADDAYDFCPNCGALMDEEVEI